MSKIIKSFLILFFSLQMVSCSSGDKDNDAKKTARTSAAQGRIGAAQSGADSITKELDQ